MVLVACLVPIILLVLLLAARWGGLLYAEARAQRRLRVASATMAVDRDPEVNRRGMSAMVERIVREHPEVDLVLFGETILGWYSVGPGTAEYLRGIAESIPGPTTRMIAVLAARHRIHLSFGMVEEKDGRLFNSQVLVDPEGRVAAVHRKVNLHRPTVFEPGPEAVTVADVRGVRTAIIVCSDIQSRAVRSRLRAERPKLILASLANPSDRGWFVAGMTARMFDAWIVTANRCGRDAGHFFDGQMTVSDPLGTLRLKARGGEQYLFADIAFAEDPAPLVRVLRRAWAGVSMAAHFLGSVRLVFGDG